MPVHNYELGKSKSKTDVGLNLFFFNLKCFETAIVKAYRTIGVYRKNMRYLHECGAEPIYMTDLLYPK